MMKYKRKLTATALFISQLKNTKGKKCMCMLKSTFTKLNQTYILMNSMQ